MTRDLMQSNAGSRQGGVVTYLVLALAGAFPLVLFAPQSLAGLGVIGHDNMELWATLLFIWLALPIGVVFLAAAILSLVGLVRGSPGHRIRLLIWWINSAVGVSISLGVVASLGFNPFLGSSQLAFSLHVGCLGLSVALPCWWVWRSARGYDMS